MQPEWSRGMPKLKAALPVAEHDHIQGASDAPLALVEYGDYECPYCGQAYPLVKAVQKQLGDRMCFVFRNFLFSNAHLNAEHAAEAAEAAALQGKFWEMHDKLLENQKALEDDALFQYAQQLGLDAPRLIQEVQSGAHNARIREDFRTGTRIGANGTPTFFMNGVRYDGELSENGLLSALTSLG